MSKRKVFIINDKVFKNYNQVDAEDIKLLVDESEKVEGGGQLTAIDEGNGIGFVLKNQDRSKHENIGILAIDLSSVFDTLINSGATGTLSFAIGLDNLVSGYASFVAGWQNKVMGNYSASFGRGNTVNGIQCFASGYENQINGENSLATGLQNVINEYLSIVSGQSNVLNGRGSSAFGIRLHTNAAGEVVVGTNSNDVPALSSTSNVRGDIVFHVGASHDHDLPLSQLFVFKSGLIKIVPVNVKGEAFNPNVPGGITGMFGLDINNNNRPTVHDGEEWQGLSYKLKEYTVSTLPASPTAGDEAIVTDGASVSYRGIVSGGGTEYVKVFYNGSNWLYI